MSDRLQSARILLLFPHMVTPGGALSYNLRLAEQLMERGATVAILTLKEDRDVFSLPAGLEVIAFDGPLTSSLGYWLLFPYWQRRISRAIYSWRPDVLVPQIFPTNWWGWLYKRNHPAVKLAWVCQEPSAFIHSSAWLRALRPWWKSVLARVLRPVLSTVDISLSQQSDRTIVNSRFTASEVKRVYGILPDAIAYPGIDFAAFSGERVQKDRSIITVAQLTKFKRVDFLLNVFREVLKIHPDLTYHIVGTGGDESFLRKYSRRLRIESRVVFHGTTDGPTLKALYQRASLFLHGSVGEPFGIAPLEAIACGTPVVAHKSGGPMEIVSEHCGRLISSLNVEDWASKISEYLVSLLAHEDSQDRIRECARRFDWMLTLQPAVDIIFGLSYEEAETH